MAVTPGPSPSRIPWWQAPWLLPLVGFVAVIATLASVILISQRIGANDQPPAAPPLNFPATGPNVTRYTVKQVAGATISISEDVATGKPPPAPRDLLLGPGTAIDVLRPIKAAEIQPGQWVQVIGIPNEVRNFSIHAIVLFPAGAAPDAERVARSPNGFAGHEASNDAADRPIIGGTVTSIAGTTLEFAGPGGPVTIQLTDVSPLYRLGTGQVGDILEGDRVAVPPSASGNAPAAILVQPTRAR
ncbi:MAG: hypothetical protein HYX53_04300 [Chloroflexi bacterium]|nr:hypothetical protein [Chloroflexota bacterium]